jgi:hypothetical protein
VVSLTPSARLTQFAVMEDLMTARILPTAVAAAALLTATFPAPLHAQDVPGIEICTVEKTMERRTSCLQSNVDFLHKTITKLTLDHQQKIDVANRQIEGLNGTVVGLKKTVADLQAAQKKMDEDLKKKTDAVPAAAKDAAPAVK